MIEFSITLPYGQPHLGTISLGYTVGSALRELLCVDGVFLSELYLDRNMPMQLFVMRL